LDVVPFNANATSKENPTKIDAPAWDMPGIDPPVAFHVGPFVGQVLLGNQVVRGNEASERNALREAAELSIAMAKKMPRRLTIEPMHVFAVRKKTAHQILEERSERMRHGLEEVVVDSPRARAVSWHGEEVQ